MALYQLLMLNRVDDIG